MGEHNLVMQRVAACENIRKPVQPSAHKKHRVFDRDNNARAGLEFTLFITQLCITCCNK